MEVTKSVMRSISLFIFLLLSGCNALPGMQNINISGMRVATYPETVRIHPTVIPINATLLVNHPPKSYVYHVEPRDILSIIVWQHPEFSPPLHQTAVVGSVSTQAAGQPGYLVDHLGRIYFPLAGYIKVANKTTDQIRLEITERLKKYIKNPQVLVRIGDFRSKKIYILGEIRNPGLLPLNDQFMSITDAITLSGGFDQEAADTRHIYIIRGNFLTPQIYWLNANSADALLLAEQFQLRPNDIIYVSSALITRWNRVMGEFLPTISSIFYVKQITGK